MRDQEERDQGERDQGERDQIESNERAYMYRTIPLAHITPFAPERESECLGCRGGASLSQSNGNYLDHKHLLNRTYIE